MQRTSPPRSSSNPNAIITVGFLLATDTLAAAKANPGVKWIGIDQFQDAYPDNYIGVLFREDQGGYLAGTMAGLLTKSNVIGVVGGLQDRAAGGPVRERVRDGRQGGKPGREGAQDLQRVVHRLGQGRCRCQAVHR